MNNEFHNFNEIAMDVVKKIRFADVLDKTLVDKLYMSLDNIFIIYKTEVLVPKTLVYNILVLHDNLEGALNYYSGEDRKAMANINSKVNQYIEKILFS
ncbi:hypothetical protein MXM31_03280 [Klebsiella aerogenes]|uniref:hypothetical protein n=1 Tax=Klebsiella aerogenes TaxID=548 RepID=UPI002D81029F|nr:hypothetical protein [Klebsiella aerogenes]MEB5695212.1 hypothetical protein [Klebsiella aerogenes]